jgi:MYXO-CTERM domain-containing protein
MRRLTLPLAIVLAAAVAGDASAKEVTAVKLCGPADCRTSRDRDVIDVVQGGGQPSIATGEKAPWYRLGIRIHLEGAHDEHFAMAFAPAIRMLRGGNRESGYEWIRLSRIDAAALGAVARGIEPFTAGKLRGTGPPAVRVDEVVVPAAHAGGSSGGDGASPVPWMVGGVGLIGAMLALLWRRRGFRRPRPSAG